MMSGIIGKPSLELEAVLVILSDEAPRIADEIAGLRSIGHYQLSNALARKIHDVYFETEDDWLRKHRMNLRVREMNGGCFITVKENPRVSSLRLLRRMETEVPWSPAALVDVMKRLENRGLKLARKSLGTAQDDPISVVKEQGFRILQDRETLRRAKDIDLVDDIRDDSLAELAVDSVTYHFRRQDVGLYEVEIESRRRKGTKAVWEVNKELLSKFGPGLRRWNHGKLATGRTIEKLLESGDLDSLLDDTVLRTGAFDKIEADMKFRSFKIRG